MAVHTSPSRRASSASHRSGARGAARRVHTPGAAQHRVAPDVPAHSPVAVNAPLTLEGALLGAPIQLRGVPESVQFLPETGGLGLVRPILVNLLAGGHLPTLEVDPAESPDLYLARVLDAWAEREHEWLCAELIPVGKRIRLRVNISEPIPVELTDFHCYLGHIHPWLAGSIIAQVTAAGRGGMEFYSPLSALEDQPEFVDAPALWKRLRKEAGQGLDLTSDAVSNAQLRRYVTRNRIWTPRRLERMLTRWTGPFAVAAERRPLDHDRICTLLAPHPQAALAYVSLREHLEAVRFFNDELIALTGNKRPRVFVAILDGDENGATLLQERYRHWDRERTDHTLDLTSGRRGAARLTTATDLLSTIVYASTNVLECLSGWPPTTAKHRAAQPQE